MPSSPSCCYTSDENQHRSPPTSCWYCPFNNQSIKLELSLFHWERFVIDFLAPLSKSKLDYVAPNYWHLCWLIWLIFFEIILQVAWGQFTDHDITLTAEIDEVRQLISYCLSTGCPQKNAAIIFFRFWTLFWPFFDLLMNLIPYKHLIYYYIMFESPFPIN